MSWKKEEFYDFIVKNDVIGFFKEPLKLKSGRLSYWYINWRNVAEDVFSLDKLSDYLLSFVKNLGLKPDCFFGVPEGATKLALITQYKWAKNQENYDKGIYALSMGRAKPKKHGAPKDKYFLGVPRGKTVVLEDVTTTGGSLLTVVNNLLENDIQIVATISLSNRNELRDDDKTVEEILRDKGVKLYAMSDAVELLPKIYQILKPGKDIGKHVEEYFLKYGNIKLKLI
ncbi:MAG: hypothetical protein ACTSRI_05020 [Promethearchaeota archaeon]